jgi:regulatory protein
MRQAVLRFLSYRPRTVQEVKQYMERKQFAEEAARQVIEEMKRLGYLNDRQYAHEWVKQRKQNKGYGSLRLRQELMKKGIDPSYIDEALVEVSEEEERQLAMRIAERRYLRICDDPWPKVERRLGQYLLRQGYSISLVRSILNRFRQRHEEEKGNG